MGEFISLSFNFFLIFIEEVSTGLNNSLTATICHYTLVLGLVVSQTQSTRIDVIIYGARHAVYFTHFMLVCHVSSNHSAKEGKVIGVSIIWSVDTS